ncbi:MAG: 50S ribosomal protein L29 [Bdellovibrionaceae bacterium]|nr:50S ribosomal protein L29 [Pseudobdellovibrionaceae bacterium]|tara:strand:+ start:244 stop:432 length:189 start_codon:yes stop_codon:yes gene_type:complete
MKFAEIKDLTVEELRKRHSSMKEELFETKMKHKLGQVGSPVDVRKIRRDIARVKTALNQKLS